MAKIKLNGDTSGYIEISAPAVSGNNTLELGPGTKILTNGGNVGVGTDNPALRAHIYSTAATDAALIESTQNFATLRFKSALNSSGPTIGIDGAGGLQLDQKDTSKYISFAIGSERLRITSGGDMGLGTASPRSIANFGSFAINGTAGSFTDYFLNGTRTGTTAVDSNGFTSEAVGSSTPFRVITNGAERLRIDSSGRLMLGQISAYAATGTGTMMLTVTKSTTSRTDVAISNQNSGDNASAALVLATHGQDYILEATGSGNTTDGTRAFRILKGSDERLRITSDGELLISNSINRFLSLDRTNASSGSGEFNVNVESNSQATISYDDGAQIVIGTSSSPRTQAGFSEKVRISSEGYVTKPNQPSFFSRPPASYNLSSGGNSPIGGTWSDVHNIGSHFSNGTFTAPVAGTYQFSWSIFSQNETTRLDAYILVNGTNVMREEINGYPNTASNKNGSVHGCYYLSANDSVTFGVYSAAGNQIYVQAHPWTYACGFLVG